MNVFVAGASGAIGRSLVPQLVAAGHEVTGMTRRRERAEEITAAGADGVVCDVFDAEKLGEVMVAARPRVVVHELTALPQRLEMRNPDLYEATNRVRTEGTANLIAAARAAGTPRLVAQGVCFIYAPTGGWVKTEEDPTIENAPGNFGAAMDAMGDLERQVTTAEGIDGLVLRYGFFYGPGTAYAADGHWAGEARRRRLPVVGKGEGMASFIHVDDAAAATVAACERGAPGIYNVVDDDPARLSEWAPAFAQAVGARSPLRIPVWLAKLVGGRVLVSLATSSRAASNGKARRELGWEPAYASWRQGFSRGIG